MRNSLIAYTGGSQLILNLDSSASALVRLLSSPELEAHSSECSECAASISEWREFLSDVGAALLDLSPRGYLLRAKPTERTSIGGTPEAFRLRGENPGR